VENPAEKPQEKKGVTGFAQIISIDSSGPLLIISVVITIFERKHTTGALQDERPCKNVWD
jgi:hypothetical protein